MVVTGKCIGGRRVRYTYPARYRCGREFPAEKREAIVYVYSTEKGFVFTSSPDWTGIYWLEGGPAPTVEKLFENYKLEAIGPFTWVEGQPLIPPQGEFTAEVAFRTRRGERQFWLAMAHSGGIAALVNKRQGYRAVDDTPGKGPIPEPEPQPDDEELVVFWIRGPRPLLAPITISLYVNFMPPGEFCYSLDYIKGTGIRSYCWVRVCEEHWKILSPLTQVYPPLLKFDGETVGGCQLCDHPEWLPALLKAARGYVERRLKTIAAVETVVEKEVEKK